MQPTNTSQQKQPHSTNTTKSKNIISHCFSSFFTLIGRGLLALAPIIILLWLLKFAYDFIAHIIGAIFDTTEHNMFATIAILVILLGILLYSGHLLEKKKDFILLKISEFFIGKIPFIASIYNVIKDMVKMFSGGNDKQYLGVGYIKLGEQEVIGFITKEESNERGEFLWVFVPTTPNPTSGFLFCAPKDKVRRSDLSVAEGFKKVVSLGIK